MSGSSLDERMNVPAGEGLDVGDAGGLVMVRISRGGDGKKRRRTCSLRFGIMRYDSGNRPVPPPRYRNVHHRNKEC